MLYNRSLFGAEAGPGKEREAEIDRGGVQGIDRLLELHAEAVVGVEAPGLVDQHLSEVGKDSPVALLACDRKGVPGDPSTNPHVVELGGHGPKTCLDVSQALPVRELGESKDQKLIPTGEAAYAAVAQVALDAPVERAVWSMLHELSENGPARIHLLPLAEGWQQDGAGAARVQIVSVYDRP